MTQTTNDSPWRRAMAQTTPGTGYDVLAQYASSMLGQVLFTDVQDRVHGALGTLCRALLEGASEAQARASLQCGPAELARLTAALVAELTPPADDAPAPLPATTDAADGREGERLCECCGQPFAEQLGQPYFCPACAADPPYWFHGGIGDLPVGALLLPPTLTGNKVAWRTESGRQAFHGYEPDRVYCTASRLDAMEYAAGNRGDAYLVVPVGISGDDPSPVVARRVTVCAWARIVGVLSRRPPLAWYRPGPSPEMARRLLTQAVPLPNPNDEGRAA